jgi:hypothetical protein
MAGMASTAYAPGGLQNLPEKLTLQTPLQQPETPPGSPQRSPVGMQPQWPFQQTPLLIHCRPFWSVSAAQTPPAAQYWHSGQLVTEQPPSAPHDMQPKQAETCTHCPLTQLTETSQGARLQSPFVTQQPGILVYWQRPR